MSLSSRRTVMARKRYKPEEIVAKLLQVDVLVSQGQNTVDAIRQVGVSERSHEALSANVAGAAPAKKNEVTTSKGALRVPSRMQPPN
jgi:hypothetical protein